MSLESGTFINDLVATNPVGATDDRSTADDHLRLIKATAKNTLPNASAPHTLGYVTGGGSANTYTVTLSPTPTSYTQGMFIRFKVPADNTGASTLNVNSLGAKAIQMAGAALAADALLTDDYVGVIYDGTAFQIIQHSRSAAGQFTDLSAANFTATAQLRVASGGVANQKETNLGNGGSSITVDGSTGNMFKITLNSATCAITLSNLPSGWVQRIQIMLVQDATGGRLFTIASPTVKWQGGSAPTLTTDGNAVDFLVFYWNGSTLYGASGLDF